MSNGRVFENPFQRPWMVHCGAAAAAAGGGDSGGKGKFTWLRGIIAGGLTGGIEICITYPTEFVKTQLQLDKGIGKYKGSVDVIQQTLKNHGFFGLYRGLSILVIGSVPKVGVRFGAFETLKSTTQKYSGQHLSVNQRLLCGLGAGMAEAIVVVTPMETIKVKLINDQRSANPRFKGLFDAMRSIIKTEGPKGVYQGVVPTVLKQGSNQAIRFFVMETLKDGYKAKNNDQKIPKYVVGMFGVVAGAASVLGNSPIDVVKTRMQGLDAHKYKNTWDCIMKIWLEEGPFAFYKGAIPRLARVCCDVAITFMVYDTIMEIFDKVWP